MLSALNRGDTTGAISYLDAAALQADIAGQANSDDFYQKFSRDVNQLRDVATAEGQVNLHEVLYILEDDCLRGGD
jgi:hypothetical protein